MISCNFWRLSFMRKSTLDHGISLNGCFSHSTSQPNLLLASCLWGVSECWCSGVKSNRSMKSHGQAWIFSCKTIAENCGKSILWSSVDFLVQDNRQKLREIVSMTYYAKAYVNILERLKYNNTAIRILTRKPGDREETGFLWNCLPVHDVMRSFFEGFAMISSLSMTSCAVFPGGTQLSSRQRGWHNSGSDHNYPRELRV